MLANIVSRSHDACHKQMLTWRRWPTNMICGYQRQNGRSRERARWRSWVRDNRSETTSTRKLNNCAHSCERANDNQVLRSHDCTQIFASRSFFMSTVLAGTLLVQHPKLRSPLCFCLTRTCCDTLNLRLSPSTAAVAASQRHFAACTSASETCMLCMHAHTQ